jgi:flagellar biosynthesis GTPase FlhF
VDKQKAVRITSAPIGRLLTGPVFMQQMREHKAEVERKKQEAIDKTIQKEQKKVDKVIQDADEKERKEQNKREREEKKERQAQVMQQVAHAKRTLKAAKEQSKEDKKAEKKKIKKKKKEKKEKKAKENAREAKLKKPCCGKKLKSDMVGCDDVDCPNGGWMHLSCLGLEKVPAGTWYCPDCV